MVWAEALTAISTAIIAVMMVGIGVVAIAFLRRAIALLGTLEDVARRIETDAKPLIEAAKTAVHDTSRVAGKLRTELEGVADTSQDIRKRLIRAVDDAEMRLMDLEALLDVIQEEIEDTVLDVGAALRTTRKGASLFRTVRRALKRGKRGRRR